VSAISPYNCTEPGHAFFGFDALRRDILTGLRNGHSFAVLGGRRCGKTSLLLRLQADIARDGLSPYTTVTGLLDVQGLPRRSVGALFREIYLLITRDIDVAAWPADAPGQYEEFLSRFDSAQQALTARYGPDWLAVLLIDELDGAIQYLEDDLFFANMRNLLMLSRFHRHFRVVASGVGDMARLIRTGSPLNNLRAYRLSVLDEENARRLIGHGFADGLNPEAVVEIAVQTGRHPYLMQGVLEKLWAVRQGAVTRENVREAARGFAREHRDFARWVEAFGPAEHAVFQCLSRAEGRCLPEQAVRRQVGKSLAPAVEDAIDVLSYHGIIEDLGPEGLRATSALFQEWYWRRQPSEGTEDRPQCPLKVFCSYSHRDERLRDRLEEHLSSLKRAGLIESWHDRRITAGKEWARQIDSHLDSAQIILLAVSASFLASDYCHDLEMVRALERHRNGHARVIPIILKPCDWKHSPIAQLQVMPNDGRAVTDWHDRDKALEAIALGIRSVVEELSGIVMV
jgi:hypothetical protein